MFKELGEIQFYIDNGVECWTVPTEELTSGCLCTDGTISIESGSNCDVVFDSLYDAFKAACDYYVTKSTFINHVYPWYILEAKEQADCRIVSFDKTKEITEERMRQEYYLYNGKPANVIAAEIVESRVMEF